MLVIGCQVSAGRSFGERPYGIAGDTTYPAGILRQNQSPPRSGAVLEGEANFGIAALPRESIFDRPFIIYMQKRGAEHPFFVMWVDNAELLTRK